MQFGGIDYQRVIDINHTFDEKKLIYKINIIPTLGLQKIILKLSRAIELVPIRVY